LEETQKEKKGGRPRLAKGIREGKKGTTPRRYKKKTQEDVHNQNARWERRGVPLSVPGEKKERRGGKEGGPSIVTCRKKNGTISQQKRRKKGGRDRGTPSCPLKKKNLESVRIDDM